MVRRTEGPSGAVMVLGGGIGGIQAALDCAEAGFAVHLVTDQPSIGGKMAQWDKTFPTNDCSMCLLGPRMSECAAHPNIKIHTLASLESLSGEPGRFTVVLKERARYIDPEECTSCGSCVEVCPVERPDEFNLGLAKRKAVYKFFPQATPDAYLIEKRGISPCRLGCPAGVHTHGYVTLIAQGRFREAWSLIRRDNPFVSVCGAVCHNPCEKVCQRGELDQPVAIKTLKAFLGHYILTRDLDWAFTQAAPAEPRREERVAVFGSGPAGLSCAYQLARRGYPVTVFEALPVAGGLMRVGIPDYRLPRRFVETEIELIRRMGVDIQTGVRVGEDLTVEDILDEGYRAVFVSVGAQTPEEAGLPGRDLPGVFYGVSFLRRVNLGQDAPDVAGRRVAVIGGGFTAVDSARTALRLGAAEVHVIFRGPEKELYALPEDIAAARAEGVRFTFLTTPLRVKGENEVEGLELMKWRVPGEGRRPVPVRKSEYVAPFDIVILATSEIPVETFFRQDPNLEWSEKGTITVDPLTLATGCEGVFAGGEAVTGPGTLIDAIASGKTAAESIDRFIRGVDLAEGRRKWPKPEEVVRLDFDPGEIPTRPRVRPFRTPDEAPEGAEVFGGYTERMAREEASRCLDCGICAECLRCEEACEKGAIHHDDQDALVELEVGSVVLAPGFAPFDPGRAGEYGYGVYPNVITAPELERLLSSTGPTGGRLERPSDGRRPRRVAFLQCVGSRSIRSEAGLTERVSGPAGHEPSSHCSAVCCMFAVKEALLIRERDPEAEVAIFNIDLRAYGKEFQRYVDSARESYGVKVINAMVSAVKEDPVTSNLRVSYAACPEAGPASGPGAVQEEFDLVVLSVGFQPPASAEDLAQKTGVKLGPSGFAETAPDRPSRTSRAGVFAAGGFLGPRDIPETITTASAAAAEVGGLLALARGEMSQTRHYPAERDITGEEARVGVFVCRCGINIASVVDVEAVVREAQSLPGVVHAQDFLYTCSQDSLTRIREAITEHRLNRVVVAACTVRTHQSLFRETLRQAGLNQFLFQMANIREQCSWVHKSDHGQATAKARDLVRMAVAKACLLEPLKLFEVPVTRRALVVGGGPAGLTAALSLAEQGFPSYVIEREDQPGGNLRRLRSTAEFAEARDLLDELVGRVDAEPLIEVLTGVEMESFSGYAGHFTTTVVARAPVESGAGTGPAAPTAGPAGAGCERRTLEHGVVIVATGNREAAPSRFAEGPVLEHSRVLTRLEFERELERGLESCGPSRAGPGSATGPGAAAGPSPRVVFTLCAGGRGHGEDPVPYCSRTCCTQALKAALEVLQAHPGADVTILYRDMVSYGFFEDLYRQAREKGVRFIRFPEGKPPVISVAGRAAGDGGPAGEGGGGPAARPGGGAPAGAAAGSGAGAAAEAVEGRLLVEATDSSLGARIALEADYVVLGVPVEPARGTENLARLLKVALTPDGFFSEVHAKLGPLDLPAVGMYVAGGAHGPKHLSEVISQARGAAARAATILAKDSLTTGGIVAEVDPDKCAACLTCVRVCPYQVPFINDDAVAEINPVQCRGCGTCAGECPAMAIQLPYYRSSQLLAQVEGLFRAASE